MAQPLFEEHPLEEYFRQTGEFAEPMPGISPDFAPEPEDPLDLDDPSDHAEIQFPQFVVSVLQIVNDLLSSSSSNSSESTFAERFKYDVISSSLLASSLAAPAGVARRAFSPELPGKLDDGGGGGDNDPLSAEKSTSAATTEPALNPNSLGQLPYVLLSLGVLALSASYYLLAILSLCTAAYVRYVVNTDSDKSDITKQTVEALSELISAGNVWDSAVHESLVLIENEERSIFYGPTSSQAPSSALRLALQSSLQTTQTQCDNVRQLLAALTSPTSLSQLAEMYAPSSPVRPPLSLVDSPRSPAASSTMRPFSVPATTPSRQRTTSFPMTSSSSKRATWNGSYAALASAGSPTAHLLKRKQMNRRSDLASLFNNLPPTMSSSSAPVSPQPTSPTPKAGLEDVMEEDDHDQSELGAKGYFGAAALDLQRKRRSAGLETFGIPPPSYALSADQLLTDLPLRSPVRGSHSRTASGISSTFSSSSRLTTVHTTRHPLSLSGLHLALQGALSAKRYTCSHLLALRFNEDEDDAYWENVRSVMALLTSTFADASSRLVEALDNAEKQRIKDEHPTPPCGPTPLSRESSISPLRHELGAGHKRAHSMADMFSFAPMPTTMARFGGHVDAISTALNDARDNLEECVAALRDASSRRSSLQSQPDTGVPSVQDHPAFQAYDRLRKELGFALRECERGRERLLDILAGPRSIAEGAEDEDASPYTPGLKQDSGSESSEKGPVSPGALVDEHGPGDAGLGLELELGRDHALDDATAHLLLATSSQHLPAPGAEQVFEAETGGAAPFARERAKLSREERIRLAKARRASGLRMFSSSSLASSIDGAEMPPQPRGERWGPGGEVVQELKDVIWKVGEQRRKFSERSQPPPVDGEEAPAAPEPEETAPFAVLEAVPGEAKDELACAPAPFREHSSRPEPIDTQRTVPPAAVVVEVEGAADVS